MTLICGTHYIGKVERKAIILNNPLDRKRWYQQCMEEVNLEVRKDERRDVIDYLAQKVNFSLSEPGRG